MIGSMLKKIRKDKNVTQAELSRNTKINLGHITHIEKGERNPSYKALKNICKFLKVPYTLLMSIYDKRITDDQINYKVFDHINYNKIISIDSSYSLIDCPEDMYNASISIKIHDNSMEPTLKNNNQAFIELGAPLENKDIGLFLYDNEILIRRFIIRKTSLVLRADNKNVPDIILSENDNFKIIGKVLGTN